MNQPPPTDKHHRPMVSKGRYLYQKGIKTLLQSVGCVSMLTTVVIGMLVVFLGVDYFQPGLVDNQTNPNSPAVLFVGLAVFGMIVIPIMGLCGWFFEKAKKVDHGVPLTRANTADLPAPDTLVRASQEPVQEQQAVLLRAATGGQETPPEQLVRPAVGPQ